MFGLFINVVWVYLDSNANVLGGEVIGVPGWRNCRGTWTKIIIQYGVGVTSISFNIDYDNPRGGVTSPIA